MVKPDEEFDQGYSEAIAEAVVASGKKISRDKLQRLVASATEDALKQTAPDVVKDLYKAAPKMLRQERRVRRGFERRLRKYWGPSLDVFVMVMRGSFEFGSTF